MGFSLISLVEVLYWVYRTFYYFRTPRKLRNGTISELNFDKYVKVTKVKRSYTELELLAELGGYVGLFLGISVFHLSQAVDKILDVIASMWNPDIGD